ncbi:Type I phosphodiesterase / nucleotide pyrophosphatase [Cnuella takakiae]|uniref:Type I phosphodiesterase / nucleotide pyrophosphatase n=1 Tax=Cnuella takakiae TaxID=1302690 RepID=A0A1M5BXJ4_9BACT|nr:alkaline phosphatase family protein [Cnuella takakiae]OLY93544.1 hypothetical protein BUE76_17930 [Cnuella takakiae]SHF47047.1 Type I phosphodiesterase / nucleotide pyrophosphatase [Cnuella takakiae]
MKQFFILFAGLLCLHGANAQKNKIENVIVVTLDGMRWQEVFNGVDSALMNSKAYTRDGEGMKTKFWDAAPEVRRQKLLPFLWQTIAANGQLHGNRAYGNQVDVANKYRFSYPGYNELFTGYPDTAVNSNDKVWNKNVNVLEFINSQPGFKGKVAAFATWDVFLYILNRQRSGLYVNADFDSFPATNPELRLLNDLQKLTTRPIDVRPDIFTYMAAREYLKVSKPRVLYLAFDETDDYAHGGQYDQYIKSAHAQDAMVADLWQTIQAMPQYKDKTALIIATDHGRGDKDKKQWRDHGEGVPEASAIWIAAMGPGLPALGEVKTPAQLYQAQVAATIASLLGIQFKVAHPVMPALQPVAGK